MLVTLWTDRLLFLLVVLVIVFCFYARSREHLRAPWRQVSRSKMGMSAAVVLLFYLFIALLDSIHFHPLLEPSGEATEQSQESLYSTEVLSVFDLLVTPLRNQGEKTYSEPFATHLYAKETIERDDASQFRDYPRLQYGGSHLADPVGDKALDIFLIALSASLEAIALWLIIGIVLCLWLARRQGITGRQTFRRILRGETEVPWQVILLTLGLLILIGFISARLGVAYHIFGTDKVGQDVFYQALKGVRTGLVIGTLTTLVMLPFAIMLGIMAGYFRGWVDDFIQYIYTTLNSIPGVLLIAAMILMLQVYMSNNSESFTNLESRADLRLLFLCIILGITSWTGLCRLLRGEALKLRSIDYIQASQAFGVGHLTIILRHILPNVMHIVLISIVLDFSGLVLAEAVLSYVNIGVDPSMQSWGNMINSARLEMAREPLVWWSLAAAFMFMFLLVLSANIFSDAVRDAFDPRLRSSII